MESNRTYISYSQFALFKSSPKAYYEKYGLDKKTFGTKYQNFGKKLMEDLEFGDVKGVPKELKELVKSGIVEFEITVKSKFIEKDLFGIVDVISENYTHFDEIKTGKAEWTKSMVAKNEQMLFYALMINLKYKVIPSATLVWAETLEDEEGGVYFTGQVKKFNRQFTLDELVDFQKEVFKVSEEISNYVHQIIDIDDSYDARLLKLLSDKKRIDDELDLLKSEIMLNITEFANTYASTENFNITLASRKKWTYSKGLNDMIKEHNEEQKMIKVSQEKSGVATYKATEYLIIKPKK